MNHEESALLGKQVRVTLGRQDGEPVIAQGKFLAYGDYGEFIIQNEDGELEFCWPLLSIEEDHG